MPFKDLQESLKTLLVDEYLATHVNSSQSLLELQQPTLDLVVKLNAIVFSDSEDLYEHLKKTGEERIVK